MMRHVVHIALMEITNSNSGDARFIFAHPFLTERTMVYRHRRFVGMDKGIRVAVTFRATPGRRYLTAVRTLTVHTSVEEFQAAFKDTLDAQARRHEEIASTYWNRSVEAPAAKATEETPKVAEIPTFADGWLDGVYVRAEERAVFEAALAITSRGEQVNLTIVGPSGYGKTTIPQAFADAKEMKCLRVNCAAVRDPEQWFGYPEAIDGTTVFVKTELTEAIEAGNAVIILDEFNRVEPWMHNILFPLLDHSRRTTVHNVEIVCGPNILFVFTMNLGYQYTGTFMMDQAMVNRSDATLRVGPLDRKIEAALLVRRYGIDSSVAQTIVAIMERLREINERGVINTDVSTRTSLKVARMISSGMVRLKIAIEATVLNGMPADEVKNAIDQIRPLLS